MTAACWTSRVSPFVGPRWALLLAALSGVTMWLAFAPVSIGPLAIVAVALFIAAVWRSSVRRGLLVGLVTGLLFFVLLLSWMRVIGTDAWLILALYCALWFVLVGGASALVTRLPGAPVWVGAVWVLEETLRGRVPLGGFPWGDLAFSQPGTPLLNYVALGGSAFLSFMVVVIAGSVVAALAELRGGAQRAAACWAVGALALILLPLVIPVATDGDEAGGESSAVVAIVQGGTPQFGMGAFDVRREVLDNHVAQTLDLAAAVAAGDAQQPDFVVWPENSSDIDPFTDPSAAAAITAAARAIDAPILVGAVITATSDPNGRWNVGVVWDPEKGPEQMYIKNHPVPFGEYIPFRDFLTRFIGRLERIPRDYLPGDQPGNLEIAGVPIGNVICFEVAYDEIVRAVVSGGARLITVQTNNATYGGTAQPDQQLAIERVRATEFGRTVVVAATSGVSAFIDPGSDLTATMEVGASGWLVEEVALRGQDTLATRIGGLVALILCVLAVGAIVMASAREWSNRRDDPIA